MQVTQKLAGMTLRVSLAEYEVLLTAIHLLATNRPLEALLTQGARRSWIKRTKGGHYIRVDKTSKRGRTADHFKRKPVDGASGLEDILSDSLALDG